MKKRIVIVTRLLRFLLRGAIRVEEGIDDWFTIREEVKMNEDYRTIRLFSVGMDILASAARDELPATRKEGLTSFILMISNKK